MALAYGESNRDLPLKHASRLKDIKEKIELSYSFSKKNAERYHEFMKLIFDTALTNDDINRLIALKKPTLEFNILEAPVNRQRGEFASQEPSISVHPVDGFPIKNITPEFVKLMEFLEGYIRWSLSDSATDGFAYDAFTDLLGGGLTAADVYNDYVSEMSFDQKIITKKLPDPTRAGYDPLSTTSHKGDGRYVWNSYPKTKEEAIEEFGEEVVKEIKFSREFGDFNWSYQNQKQDILVICDYYEKKKKKEKLVKLSSGDKILKKHYDKLIEEWNERGFIEQPPIIIEERWTELETIVRYRVCEKKVLSYDETDYKFFPIVFGFGNSVPIKNEDNNCTVEMARPYPYHAKGIQRGKNFAGQTVFGEIENLVQHKWKASVESVPEDFQEAYRNPQLADVLLHNAFYKGDPNVPLAPPMEVQRAPIPPIVENIFINSDAVAQAILGSYDSVMGTNDKDLSGKTIANASIHTSSAAAPYLMGYIKMLNQIGKIYLDLIPKYIVTPRTLPIIKADGKRGFQVVNTPGHPDNIDLKYNSEDLHIQIEAGVNSSIRKQEALDVAIKLSAALPDTFGKFFSSVGLETIMDNLEMRNIEALKAKVPEYLEMEKKRAEEAAATPDPQTQINQGLLRVEAAKVAQKEEEAKGKLALETAKVAVEKEKITAQVMQIMNDIENKNSKLAIEQEKVDSENARTAIETAMDLSKHHHEKEMDKAALKKPKKDSKKKEK